MYHINVYCASFDSPYELQEFVQRTLGAFAHWELITLTYSTAAVSHPEYDKTIVINYSVLIYMRLKKDVDTLLAEREQRLKNLGL